MSYVIDQEGNIFGPFVVIEAHDGGLICDHALELQTTVIGNYSLHDDAPPGSPSDYLWDGAQYVLRPEAYARLAGELEAAVTGEAQRRLDAFAQERGYDGIVSLCSYASDPDPHFSGEAAQGIAKRSATWAFFRNLRASTPQTGALPTFDDVMAQYASAVDLSWPQA